MAPVKFLLKVIKDFQNGTRAAESECTDILMMRGYGDHKQSFEEVRALFNTSYPHCQIT